MMKKKTDLVKGDIIRVEFGEYDNWVTVIVDKVVDDGDGWLKIYCRYLMNGKPEIMFAFTDEVVEVID